MKVGFWMNFFFSSPYFFSCFYNSVRMSLCTMVWLYFYASWVPRVQTNKTNSLTGRRLHWPSLSRTLLKSHALSIFKLFIIYFDIFSLLDSVAATVTPQHLLLNRNSLFQGGLQPHNYCLPVLKREIHSTCNCSLCQQKKIYFLHLLWNTLTVYNTCGKSGITCNDWQPKYWCSSLGTTYQN